MLFLFSSLLVFTILLLVMMNMRCSAFVQHGASPESPSRKSSKVRRYFPCRGGGERPRGSRKRQLAWPLWLLSGSLQLSGLWWRSGRCNQTKITLEWLMEYHRIWKLLTMMQRCKRSLNTKALEHEPNRRKPIPQSQPAQAMFQGKLMPAHGWSMRRHIL